MTTIKKLKQTNNTDTHEENELKSQRKTVESNISVIHVVSAQKQTGSKTIMVPFKNITVIRPLVSCDGIVRKELDPQKPTELGKAEVYQKRKRMLPEYKELFAALMKLSDKEIQKKLLAVINNHHEIEHRSIETQTDPIEFKESTNVKQAEKSAEDTAVESTAMTNDTNISGDVVKKRKRKRKVSLPQVNKESRAKKLAKVNMPKTSVANGNSTTMSPKLNNSTKLQRQDSSGLLECIIDVVNTFEDTLTNPTIEIEQSDCPLENGLWPIQDAVVRNQINKLKLHIHIQKKKGKDLNDIITEEDEDLLQLAVLNTCDPSIISLLLENGLNPNTLDVDSNTIIHLAILNDITDSALEHLMKRIDLKLLLTSNDDGYTPLHLAIRQDRFQLAECLINVLDERLMNKTFYKRQVDQFETDENLLKKQFKDYYEKVCLRMISDENTIVVENHDLKQKLLQAGDRRSGNTALYFAIDNKLEHLIYFLLAHLTDPRTENLCGLDCKTYFSEYGKSLNLSLNIDNTMEKVIKLLS